MPILGLSILRVFEARGTPCLLSSEAIARSRDKLRALEILAAAGLPVPRTVFVKDLDQLDFAIGAVGGAPVLLKPLEGSQGRGVVLAESRMTAITALQAFLYLNRDLIVQEFFAESGGVDLRVFVVGDKIAAAARRSAAPGEFRANYHAGAQLAPAELPAELQRLALAAARALGLPVAGVDLLETRRGPVILEVNSAPGLEGIETATGVDVAAVILDYLEHIAATGPGSSVDAGAPEPPAARTGEP